MAVMAVGVAAAQRRVVALLACAEELARHKLDRVGEQRRRRRDDGGPWEVGPPQARVLSPARHECHERTGALEDFGSTWQA